MQPAEGVLGHVGGRLAQHVELARVLDVVQLVPHPVLVQPLGAQLELGGGPAAGVGFVELVDVHRRHTIADLGDRDSPAVLTSRPGGGIGGGADRDGGAMPTTQTKQRVALIDQMTAEWQSIGRSPGAVRALRAVAGRDPGLSGLVLGTASGPAPCPTPCDVVEHMRRASGRTQREEAARLVRVLLREADADPFVGRMLVQVLLPGLVTVAGKLRWGQGGDWQDGEEFFGELLATTWLVLREWAGQDRPYAVLDLLSAIRCRLRRQLFRAKDLGGRVGRARPRRGRRAILPRRDRPRGAGPDPRSTCTATACGPTTSRSSTPTTSSGTRSPSSPP